MEKAVTIKSKYIKAPGMGEIILEKPGSDETVGAAIRNNSGKSLVIQVNDPKGLYLDKDNPIVIQPYKSYGLKEDEIGKSMLQSIEEGDFWAVYLNMNENI